MTTIMSDRDGSPQTADNKPMLPVQSAWNIFPAMSGGTLQLLHVQFSTYLFALLLPRHVSRQVIYVLALLSIRFALTKTHLRVGFVEETSPQAVNCLRNSGLQLWATPRFPGKRYRCDTSYIVESWNGPAGGGRRSGRGFVSINLTRSF